MSHLPCLMLGFGRFGRDIISGVERSLADSADFHERDEITEIRPFLKFAQIDYEEIDPSRRLPADIASSVFSIPQYNSLKPFSLDRSVAAKAIRAALGVDGQGRPLSDLRANLHACLEALQETRLRLGLPGPVRIFAVADLGDPRTAACLVPVMTMIGDIQKAEFTYVGLFSISSRLVEATPELVDAQACVVLKEIDEHQKSKRPLFGKVFLVDHRTAKGYLKSTDLISACTHFSYSFCCMDTSDPNFEGMFVSSRDGSRCYGSFGASGYSYPFRDVVRHCSLRSVREAYVYLDAELKQCSPKVYDVVQEAAFFIGKEAPPDPAHPVPMAADIDAIRGSVMYRRLELETGRFRENNRATKEAFDRSLSTIVKSERWNRIVKALDLDRVAIEQWPQMLYEINALIHLSIVNQYPAQIIVQLEKARKKFEDALEAFVDGFFENTFDGEALLNPATVAYHALHALYRFYKIEIEERADLAGRREREQSAKASRVEEDIRHHEQRLAEAIESLPQKGAVAARVLVAVSILGPLSYLPFRHFLAPVLPVFSAFSPALVGTGLTSILVAAVAAGIGHFYYGRYISNIRFHREKLVHLLEQKFALVEERVKDQALDAYYQGLLACIERYLPKGANQSGGKPTELQVFVAGLAEARSVVDEELASLEREIRVRSSEVDLPEPDVRDPVEMQTEYSHADLPPRQSLRTALTDELNQRRPLFGKQAAYWRRFDSVLVRRSFLEVLYSSVARTTFRPVMATADVSRRLHGKLQRTGPNTLANALTGKLWVLLNYNSAMCMAPPHMTFMDQQVLVTSARGDVLDNPGLFGPMAFISTTNDNVRICLMRLVTGLSLESVFSGMKMAAISEQLLADNRALLPVALDGVNQ